MANTLLTIGMRTKEALRILENKLGFTKYISHNYDDKFAQKDAKIGNSVDIRKPPRFIGRTGDALSLEDVTETFVTLTLDTKFGVDVVFSSDELALDINTFAQKFLKSRVAVIANRIDFDGLKLYKDVYNAIGTPGTVPSTRLLYLQAGQRLNEEAAPDDDDRSMIVTPAMEATIVNTDAALFNPSRSLSDQYMYGKKGHALGFKFTMDQNVATHTSGVFTAGSTPVVAGADQTGSSLATSGWANSTAVLTRGDVITISTGTAVNAVNPQSRQDTAALRQFVVTDDVTSDGAGLATIPISPAITVSGPFQTVTASPDNAATVAPLGAESTNSPQGLGFHPEAFAIASVDLPLFRGTHAASREHSKNIGISIRTIEDYDINLDRAPCRLDVLYGHVTLYPELACRMVS